MGNGVMNVKDSYRIFLTVCMFVSAYLENETANILRKYVHRTDTLQ